MKAITRDVYGSAADVLAINDIDRPVIDADEVLLRVHAASARR